MPLHRPRRIFRSSAGAVPATAVHGLVGLSIAGLALAGVVALGAASTDLFGRSPGAPSRIAAEAQQIDVVDGETLRLHDTVIRLRFIAAPARGAPCRAPDGTSLDCGTAAAHALADLVRGHAVQCRLQAMDTLGRPLAMCDAQGTGLNQAMVEAGWARSQDGPPALQAAQAVARSRRLGLWADPGRSS